MQIYGAILAAIPSVLETAKRVKTHIPDAVALLLKFDQLFRLHDRHVGRASLVLIDQYQVGAAGRSGKLLFRECWCSTHHDRGLLAGWLAGPERHWLWGLDETPTAAPSLTLLPPTTSSVKNGSAV